METKQILTIKRNNKLVLSSMTKQYAVRAVLSSFEAFDRFMVWTGRIQPEAVPEKL